MATRRIGKYRILEQIDRGGMGTVYRAIDTELGRTVALKVLSPQLSAAPDFVERFRREAVTAGNLHHQNIATIFEMGLDDEQYYIAMEYVNGRDLHKMIRAEGRMDLERVGALLAQIGAALDYAHRLGVVHRDIKPSNILLNELDEIKLVDFGIARALGAATQLTSGHLRMGTPQYTSPEQAEGAPVDGRSDIYSLGIVVYELLTGRVPFAAETTDAVLYAHIHTAPRPLHEQRQNIPPRVEQVVLKALAKNPQDRFQTAGEFARAYQEACSKEAAKAQHPPKKMSCILPAIALLLCAALAVYFGLRATGAFRVAEPTPILPAPTTVLLTAAAPTTALTPARSAARPTATRRPTAVTRIPTAATGARAATATITASSAQMQPTATLFPTRTPAVVPPTTTLVVKPPTRAPSPTSVIIQALPPGLSQPPNNDSRMGRVTFSWTPATMLPSGAAYEVIWWDEGAAPETAQALAPSTTDTAQEIDLSLLGIKRIRWTVRVVQTRPPKPLTAPDAGTIYALAVCQWQEQTCTRTILNPEGETVTESYDCNKQTCP